MSEQTERGKGEGCNMKFSEEILKEFKIEPKAEKEPINIMQVGEVLNFLNKCAERIVLKSNLFVTTQAVDVEADCIDIVTAKLNDFSQAFRDIIIFLRKYENSYNGESNSLRYCVSSYDTFDFQQTESEKSFLRELLLRNEITHDYFNREMHQQKLIWIMSNCASGAMDIYNKLYEYCETNGLLEKYIDNR